MPAKLEPNDTTVTDFARRSPVYRRLIAHGARFGEAWGAAVALDFGDAEAEARHGRGIGLADLSPLPRVGFKGAGAIEWLVNQGVVLEAAPNRAWRQPGGELAVVRSKSEALILAGVAARGGLCEELEARSAEAAKVRAYLLPRFDALFRFALTGGLAHECMAKLCSVDLRPATFGDLSVAQTLVAGVGAVVTRLDLGSAPAFHLLGDRATADYFWNCLSDSMEEFGGRVVGLTALRLMAGRE